MYHLPRAQKIEYFLDSRTQLMLEYFLSSRRKSTTCVLNMQVVLDLKGIKNNKQGKGDTIHNIRKYYWTSFFKATSPLYVAAVLF